MMKKFIILLISIFIFALVIFCFCNTKNSDYNNDMPPLIMYDGYLYKNDSFDGNLDNLINVGIVQSYVSNGIPTKNYEANDDLIGCKIYLIEDSNYIFVLNDGRYLPYKKLQER